MINRFIVSAGLALILMSTTWSNVVAMSQTDAPPTNLQPLENLANNWLKRPELQHSLVGLEIMHIPSGQTLFSFNGRRRFVPASVTKVFSTACAMDLLGADYRYKTKLRAYGQIHAGKFTGELVIEPSQDPTLTSADLRQLLSVLEEKGIKSIEGQVELIAIAGGGDRFATSWLAEDWGQDWMPCSSDLVVDDNIAHRDPARGYPLVSVPSEHNGLLRSLLDSPFGPSWVCFNPANETMQFSRPTGAAVGGQIVANPQQYNLAIIKSMLSGMHIKIKHKSIPAQTLSEPPCFVAEHSSKPLSEIIRRCLKQSDNLYAQQILRTIGTLTSASKASEQVSLEERGLIRLNQWLVSFGVGNGDVVLWDGCGLSRKDCLTPHALNLVHKHMSVNSSYIDVMPLDGASNSVNGSFRYKTGAMDSVKSITGLVRTQAGEPLAVTVMVNAHSPSVRELRASIGSLIDHLQSMASLRLAPAPPAAKVLPSRARHTGNRKHVPVRAIKAKKKSK